MPGFPIRTSSDQRSIDNSPRLNAALHVLHRLSMPRHPPCALNNEHTNHHTTKNHAVATQVNLTKILIKEKRNHTNTHKQTTRPIHLCLMLASTIQFSHNTPTTPCQHQPCQQDSWSGTKKGDNAPDTQQCTNIQTTITFHCARHVYHKAPFKHLALSLKVCVPPGQFLLKRLAA